MQSNNSTFDPSSLLDTAYEDDLNTRLVPVPEGEYYARIKSIDVRKQARKDGTGDVYLADFIFIVEDEEVKKKLNMPEPQVRMSVFLDLKPGTSQLLTKEDNPNANVKLGQIKAALGFRPGRKWTLRSFEGMSCYIKTRQRSDPNDIEIIYTDVTSVRKDKSGAGEAKAA